MIRGTVTPDREAIIHIRITGPTGSAELDAIIDTGFNDLLTLPISQIKALDLPFATPLLATLADGTVVETKSYRLTIDWDGRPRKIFAIECAGEPLVGMSLLYDHNVQIEAIDHGLVTIERRPATKGFS